MLDVLCLSMMLLELSLFLPRLFEHLLPPDAPPFPASLLLLLPLFFSKFISFDLFMFIYIYIYIDIYFTKNPCLFNSFAAYSNVFHHCNVDVVAVRVGKWR